MSAIEHLIATENLQASVIEWLRSSESYHRQTSLQSQNPEELCMASFDSSLNSNEGTKFKRSNQPNAEKERGFPGSNNSRRNGAFKFHSVMPKRGGLRSSVREPRRNPTSQIAPGPEVVSSIEELTEKMQMIFAVGKANENESLKKRLMVRTSSLEDDNRSDLSSRTSDASNQLKFKTRMCKAFAATGFCRYGNGCTFAHYEKEKRKDISTIYKFKTDLCHAWLKGACMFGSACHFAHGPSELVANTL